MDLFNQDAKTNILPCDGRAEYYGRVLKQSEAKHYFQELMNTTDWKNEEVVMFGKSIVMSRKVAWYGNKTFSYEYSGSTKHASIWTKPLAELKEKVEELSGVTYNSCLLNLYHDGEEGMGWHSDDEDTLGPNNTIASLSLGAERKFSFKHKTTKQTVSIILENGSLLVMKEDTQAHWLHSLPKSVKIKTPRINLTFRTIIM
jgi:alkylated DNA repair dioxygenase AlkB